MYGTYGTPARLAFLGRGRVGAALILFALGITFCGCGSDISMSLQPVSVNVSAQASARIGTVTNFGDSITCGVGASSGSRGYSALLDAAISKPSQNFCRSGDQAADMARLGVYPNAVPVLGSSQLYTVLIGTNDANACGSSNACQANYTQSLAASLAWLALPSVDKVLANNITTRTGTWSTDLGFGLASTNNAASLSFTLQQTVAGRHMYLAYRVADPSLITGTAVVSVDGTVVANLNGSPGTGHPLLTQNGTTDTIFLLSVPLGAVGQHAVTLSLTSPDGALFSFMWAGVSSNSYVAVAGSPRVLIGGITTALSTNLDATIAQYNSSLEQTVAGFAADGLNIQIAPTATALNPDTDLADSLHPNDRGHSELAAAFSSAL